MGSTLRDRLDRAWRDLEPARRSEVEAGLGAAGLDLDSPLDSATLESVLLDRETSSDVRATVAWLAGQVREESLLPALERMAQSEEEPVVLWEVAKSLCALGRGRASFRRKLSTGGTPEERRIAAFALGCLRDRESVAALRRCVDDPAEDVVVRGQAAEALGYVGDRRAYSSLAAAAADPAPEVRFWAVFALGRLGDPRARGLLEEVARRDLSSLEGWGSIAEEARQALEDLQ